MEQIKIKQIKIYLQSKEFSYYVSDKKEKIDEVLRQKEEFTKNVFLSYEKKTDGYRVEYTVYYYTGSIEFLPTKTDSSTLTLEIKADKGLLQLITSMCLENVAEVCDKQTQLFKSMFVASVEDGKEEIGKKIKSSFLSKFNKNKAIE